MHAPTHLPPIRSRASSRSAISSRRCSGCLAPVPLLDLLLGRRSVEPVLLEAPEDSPVVLLAGADLEIVVRIDREAQRDAAKQVADLLDVTISERPLELPSLVGS